MRQNNFNKNYYTKSNTLNSHKSHDEYDAPYSIDNLSRDRIEKSPSLKESIENKWNQIKANKNRININMIHKHTLDNNSKLDINETKHKLLMNPKFNNLVELIETEPNHKNYFSEEKVKPKIINNINIYDIKYNVKLRTKNETNKEKLEKIKSNFLKYNNNPRVNTYSPEERDDKFKNFKEKRETDINQQLKHLLSPVMRGNNFI